MGKRNVEVIQSMRQFVDYDNPENSDEPLLAFGERPKLKEFRWKRDDISYEYRATSERLQVDIPDQDAPIRVIVRFQNLYAPLGPHIASSTSDAIMPNHSKKGLVILPEVVGWNYELESDIDEWYVPEDLAPDSWKHDE